MSAEDGLGALSGVETSMSGCDSWDGRLPMEAYSIKAKLCIRLGMWIYGARQDVFPPLDTAAQPQPQQEAAHHHILTVGHRQEEQEQRQIIYQQVHIQ